MSRKKLTWLMIALGLFSLLVLYTLQLLRIGFDKSENLNDIGGYNHLPADTSTDDPLKYITSDFTVKEGFHSNLPIVILSLEGELTKYKSFQSDREVVDKSVDPWTKGTIRIIDQENYKNTLNDASVYESSMHIKKRGHSSFTYDKSQYLMKMTDKDGEKNNTEILDMGKGDSWILNGSMADKSMLRNYLGYRIGFEIGGSVMAPNSRFCEVLIYKDGKYKYQGVYLLQETVSRGDSRVSIDKYKQKNTYTSYIVRRDRFTSFDTMLNTYGRLNGLTSSWIGVKYPSSKKLTEESKQFIENDFSRIEKVLYSEKESEFNVYDKYIDIDSFVDYFLINEFFGNYDAGEHSTYMYKNTGGKLYIGPVWDFDQAMNNYFMEEMDPDTLAFQTKPFFKELVEDRRFITSLKKRYSILRKGTLSEKHVYAVIDEAVSYLKSAREREWYRWAADYEEGAFDNPHNYYLQDYVKEGVNISRFNDDYDQEIYNIRKYLHKHGNSIQYELAKFYNLAIYDTSWKDKRGLLFIIIMTMFLVPSFLINRKG